MTNREILREALRNAGLSEDTKIDTYAGWKRAGLQVRKGEKATLTAKIWMPRPKRKKDEEAEADPTEETTKKSRFIMVKSGYFTEDQVYDAAAEEALKKRSKIAQVLAGKAS